MTWDGWFGSTASFPVVNAHLCAALERHGLTIWRNVHNGDWNTTLTPLLVQFRYPPSAPVLRHHRNVCLSLWEFWGGARAVPDSFKRAFAAYDLVVAPNQFVYEQYCQATKTPVRIARYLGVDAEHFSPDGPVADLRALFPGETWIEKAQKIVLMVGGSDKRHGWDVAQRVMDALPEQVHMIAKLSIHYPRKESEPEHPRIHKCTADLSDLAPLYRACDAFLLSARGVGFSLPAIEAMACGLPVASTNLPPVRDYATERVIVAQEGRVVPLGGHHVHHDCLPDWWEPDADALTDALLRALLLEKKAPPAEWIAHWSWDAVAGEVLETLRDVSL